MRWGKCTDDRRDSFNPNIEDLTDYLKCCIMGLTKTTKHKGDDIMNKKGLNKIISVLEKHGVDYSLLTVECEYKGNTINGNAIEIGTHYFIAYRGMVIVKRANDAYFGYTLKNQNMALCYIFGYNNVLPNNYITVELDDETGAILGFSKNETLEESVTEEPSEAELEAIAEKFAPKFMSELTPEELEQLVEKAGNSILEMEKQALEIYENIKANSAESLPLEIWEKVYNFTSECYNVWHDSLDVISDEKKISKQFKVLKEELLSYAKKPEQPTAATTEKTPEAETIEHIKTTFELLKKYIDENGYFIFSESENYCLYAHTTHHYGTGKKLIELSHEDFKFEHIVTVDYETLELIDATDWEKNLPLTNREILNLLKLAAYRMQFEQKIA